jgi:hypothetical protein
MIHQVLCDTCFIVVGEYENDGIALSAAQQHDFKHHKGECHTSFNEYPEGNDTIETLDPIYI